MSSTERAPEPTMEEILASIRRIISDDESNAARPHPATATQQDDEGPEAGESEADDRIIDDIARVLSASAPKVEDEEDILDLTAELSGGMEAGEEVLLEELLVEEVTETLEMPPEAIVPPEPPRAEPVLAEAQPSEPQVEAPAAPPLSASEEAASALERAIAALRAGQLPTSVAGFMPQPEPVPQPQAFSPTPEPFAFTPGPAPEPFAFTPGPEPELVSEPAPLPEAEPQPEREPELPEFAAGTIVEETVLIETPFETAPVESEPEESAAEESVAAPVEPLPWSVPPATPSESEHPTARKNGGSHGASPLAASHKTLEDSVKDMLRPMLKQWLDENMPRVLTAALKEELGERGGLRQGD